MLITNDLLTPHEVLEEERRYAALSGLGRDQFIVVPYGRIPALPRPPLAALNGTGKLPPNVRIQIAGDPVFWLDATTRRQQPGEDDRRYAVRLWLELVDRGLADPTTGLRPSVLAQVGIDIDDPLAATRVYDYMAGAIDADLCGLELGPNNMGLTEAMELAAYATNNYEQALALQHQELARDLAEQADAALGRLAVAEDSSRADMQRLGEAATVLHEAGQKGYHERALEHLKQKVVAALGEVTGGLAEIEADRLIVSYAHKPPEPAEDALADLEALKDRFVDGLEARQARLDALVTEVLRRPERIENFQVLFDELEATRASLSDGAAAAHEESD
ncbi:MAG: hypothetical protein JO086_02565 [Acidimicrobiia bacterium]|nr:hypothetical protein [Acidimicrobiia bacterium]